MEQEILKNPLAGPKPLKIENYQKRKINQQVHTSTKKKTKRAGRRIGTAKRIALLRRVVLEMSGEPARRLGAEISTLQKELNAMKRKNGKTTHTTNGETIQTDIADARDEVNDHVGEPSSWQELKTLKAKMAAQEERQRLAGQATLLWQHEILEEFEINML